MIEIRLWAGSDVLRLRRRGVIGSGVGDIGAEHIERLSGYLRDTTKLV